MLGQRATSYTVNQQSRTLPHSPSTPHSILDQILNASAVLLSLGDGRVSPVSVLLLFSTLALVVVDDICPTCQLN